MALVPGTRLGPYEVLAPLGAGAMGEVYRARDTRLDRFVAIKVLTPHEAEGHHRLDRLEREARAISRVNHRNICALHDVGRQNGHAFLVMEYLEGETLARRLEIGAVPLARALVYAAEIADALDAAHRCGVVHRDLKPSNIMLTPAGVKVLDFGLAKLRDAALDPEAAEAARTATAVQTEAGTILGTYPYMSPEQVEGREVDARSDIFALGVVLYETIDGRRPFEGSSHAALAVAILTHDPPGIATRCAAASPLVERIVAKCLAKNPDERWQSASDVASELRWATNEQPHTASTVAEAVTHRGGVRRWLAATTALGVVAGALGLWALVARGVVRAPSAVAPRFIPVTFRAGSVNSARFAPDGETVVYTASWQGQPYTLYMTRRGSPESRSLNVQDARLLGISSSGDLAFLRSDHQSLGWAPYRSRIVGTLARVSLTGGAPRELLDDVFAADWNPVNAELAVAHRVSGSGAVSTIEFPLGKPIYRSETAPTWMRIAPQGDRLAIVEGGSVAVIDRSGARTVLSKDWDVAGSLAWSPDGREVWFSAGGSGTSDPTLHAVSLSGRERPLFHADPGFLAILDVFRDGRALMARHTARFTFTCLPPDSARERDLGWFDLSAPEALSADGRTVVFGEAVSGLQSAYLRKTDGSDAVRLGDGYPEDLAPDGKSVLVGLRRVGAMRWTILPTGAGPPLSPVPAPFEQLGEANFLPDGRRFVFTAWEKGRPMRVYVQNVQGGSPRAISPEGVFSDGVSTPDGQFVVGSIDGKHALYPVAGGAPRPLPSLTAADTPLQWSSDGRHVYARSRDSWPPVVNRIDLHSGDRQIWKTLVPADAAGLDSIFRILITPDGKYYCYDHLHFLSNLYIVEGLR
jgi:eukaryotic-like serine/threonine-protein kinase